MPVWPGKYRVTKSGVRIHITPSGTVNEAKNMRSGATHTAAEFKADRKRSAQKSCPDCGTSMGNASKSCPNCGHRMS